MSRCVQAFDWYWISLVCFHKGEATGPEDGAQPETTINSEPDTQDTTSAPGEKGAESTTEVMEALDTDQPAPTEASQVKSTAWAESYASEGAATESLSIGMTVEGNGTQKASPTEHPGVVVTEMEETTVSGMLPSGSDEEGASSMAPSVKEPGEPQGRAREEDLQEKEVEVGGKEWLFVTYITLHTECCFLLRRSVWYLEENDYNLFQ